jgi:hypothetical protein
VEHIDYRTIKAIENAANNSGWENAEVAEDEVVLSSSLCDGPVQVKSIPGAGYSLTFVAPLLAEKMTVEYGASALSHIAGFDALTSILKRASVIASSLPQSPYKEYMEQIKRLDITDTERLAVEKERIGQELYRNALLRFWNYRCVLTGVDQQELLVASHAKPWAACSTPEERLNVFNGFIFEARFDRLFDQGFISFDDQGLIMISPKLSMENRKALGLDTSMAIKGIESAHRPFLAYHREHVFFA